VSDSKPTRNIARSIGAILAGFVLLFLLSLGTDEVLHLTGVFPPWGASMMGYEAALLLATFYRVIFGIVGSYVTARLAPNQPMQHALLGGLIGLLSSIIGAAVTWNGGPAFGPHWYPLALVVTALPTAWLGGKLRLMQLRRTAHNDEPQSASIA
jgi:uncharacterized membrane protein YeaQ/YmgE (transglycosylase-associated protein family)